MKSIVYKVVLLSFLALLGCKSDKNQPSSNLKNKKLEATYKQGSRSLLQKKDPLIESKIPLLPEALHQGNLKSDLSLSQPLEIVNTSFKIKGQKLQKLKSLSCNNKKRVGIYLIDAELVLENLIIKNCIVSAIKLIRSTLILNNVKIKYSGFNLSIKDDFGGFDSQPVAIAALDASTVIMNGDSEISYNLGEFAGAVYLESNSRLEMNDNSSIKKNKGTSLAGGVYSKDSHITINDHANISNNTVRSERNGAGGIYLLGSEDNKATLIMNKASRIQFNRNEYGGVFAKGNSAIQMNDESAIFENGTYESLVGGIFVSDHSTLVMRNNSRVQKNSGQTGGIKTGPSDFLKTHNKLTITIDMEDDSKVTQNKALSINPIAALVGNRLNAVKSVGGIHLSNTSMIMTGRSEISSNEGFTGGLVIRSNSIFNMTNHSSIQNNGGVVAGGVLVPWPSSYDSDSGETAELSLKDQVSITRNFIRSHNEFGVGGIKYTRGTKLDLDAKSMGKYFFENQGFRSDRNWFEFNESLIE